jgi:hypothetical protein
MLNGKPDHHEADLVLKTYDLSRARADQRAWRTDAGGELGG